MSIARITDMVTAKTALGTVSTYDSVYVGEFMVGTTKTPQYVRLTQPFTSFEMMLLLDYVQMSPLEVTLNIYDPEKRLTHASFSPYFADADMAKRFMGLLLFVIDPELKQIFNSYYYTNPTDTLETLVTSYLVTPYRPTPYTHYRPRPLSVRWV